MGATLTSDSRTVLRSWRLGRPVESVIEGRGDGSGNPEGLARGLPVLASLGSVSLPLVHADEIEIKKRSATTAACRLTLLIPCDHPCPGEGNAQLA
jgi:hypothetical protein